MITFISTAVMWLVQLWLTAIVIAADMHRKDNNESPIISSKRHLLLCCTPWSMVILQYVYSD